MTTFQELLDRLDALSNQEEPYPEESWRQRFRGCCGACDEFIRCELEGHEEIGWCSCDRSFVRADDPDECD